MRQFKLFLFMSPLYAAENVAAHYGKLLERDPLAECVILS